MSFRHAIVAFDGSPQSQDALVLALRLLDPADCALTLACVVSGRRWHVGPEVVRPDSLVPEEIALMFADARASAIPAGLHVRQRAPVAPSPARGLADLAESEDADLIVIGSSAHAEAGRVRLERTAGRLLERAPCAVAIAPGGLRDHAAFRRIAVAYDDSAEARSALEAVYDIAASCAATVTLVHALPPSEREPLAAVAAQSALVEAAGRAPAGVSPRTMLVHGWPAEVIRPACEGAYDLLVTGSRSYPPMKRALLGSVSEQLAEGASLPVLVVPHAGAAPEHGGKTHVRSRGSTDGSGHIVGHA